MMTSSATPSPFSLDVAPVRASRGVLSRALPAVLLLVLACAAVAPALAPGRTFPPLTPAVASFSYAIDRLRTGEAPLWNPHEGLGTPLVGDDRTAPFYPPAVIAHLVLPTPRAAFAAVAVLHLWLAGSGAMRLGRRYDLTPSGSLLAGAAFMLGGSTVIPQAGTEGNVVVWLPWTILVAEWLIERRTAMRLALASALVAVQVLGGAIATTLALVATVTLFLAVRAVVSRPLRVGAAVPWLVIATVVGLALAGAHWLPTVARIRAGAVPSPTGDVLPAPWLLGPLDPLAPGLIGVIALVLAAVGIRRTWPDRVTVLWTVLGGIAAIVAIALFACERLARVVGFADVAALAPAVVSPWSWLALVALAAALLAGIGLEAAVRPVIGGRPGSSSLPHLGSIAAAVATIALVGVACAYLLTAGEGSGGILAFARLFVVAAMAGAAALVLRSQRVPRANSAHAPVWPWLALACAELLAFVLPWTAGMPSAQLERLAAVAGRVRELSAAEPAVRVAASGNAAVPPHVGTWQRVDDVRGAGAGGGLIAPRQRAWLHLAGAAGGDVRADRLDDPAMRVAGVRYFIDRTGAAPPPAPWKQAAQDARRTIYANDGALPRAWVAERAEMLDSADAVFDRLRGDGSEGATADPRRVVLIDPGFSPRHRESVGDTEWWKRTIRGNPNAQVVYNRASPEEVRVRVRGGRGGWLVVADAFDDGWRATALGRDAIVAPAFGALRGVPLAPGVTDVLFRYKPPAWRYGLFVSAGGAVVWLLLVGIGMTRAAGDAEIDRRHTRG